MKARFFCLLMFLVACAHGEQASPVTPKVDSVSLFKNGLSVVKVSFEAPKAGQYAWVNPPMAVHGAFYVESAPGMVIRSTRQVMDAEEGWVSSGSLQKDLAGAAVGLVVEGNGDQDPVTLRGRVWKASEEDIKWWSPNQSRGDFAIISGVSHYSNRRQQATPRSYGDWLVLEVEGKRQFIAVDRVSRIWVEQESEQKAPRAEKPVLLFSAAKAGKVRVTYLTKGMAWMPAYEIDLLAKDRLKLRQTAVIRNELMDLKGAKLELISGFPNIEFSHVGSALNPGANLSAFFKQINGNGRSGYGGFLGQMTLSNSIQAVVNNPTRFEMSEADMKESSPADDLHYQDIGVHELAMGDSLSLEVAAAEAKCERVVEWLVPDFRDHNGVIQRNQEHKDEHDPWDVVLFPNPLKFPMTTAAASTLEKGRFLGQSMSMWTGPGKEASIKVGKALTVRTEHNVVEEEKKREPINVFNKRYYETKLKGELKLLNTRSEPVKMVIRRDFSGELIEADGEPESHLRATGARSVNPRRRLKWTIELKPGEARTLNYRYSLLVYY